MNHASNHMYTPRKMARNLGIGNIGEAFFRYWYETHCNELDDLSLRQFGYNPEGIVVGEEKKEMLKQLERSTDFAIYRAVDLDEDPQEAKPILGISVNTQKYTYTMSQARAPKMEYKGESWGCFNCPRGNRCFDHEIGNLWYNEYNISNDYLLFRNEFGADVLLITIISKMPYTVWNGKIKKGEFDDELRRYLLDGKFSISESQDVVDFLDYLLFLRAQVTSPRDYEIVWLSYSDILSGKIRYHITGAPVSRGRPRPVVCIDLINSRSERELIKFIEDQSEFECRPLPPRWYADPKDGNARC